MKRYKNYFLFREREYEEVPWIRPEEVKTLQDLPRPIVLINGAYDILTVSHMRLIFSARSKAKTLICCVDSDEKIKKSKGEDRPILSFIERTAALNYMPLDYIIEINDKKDMDKVVKGLKPDLRVQGTEYRGKPSRYNIQKMFVRDGALHTSTIIERILERYGKN